MPPVLIIHNGEDGKVAFLGLMRFLKGFLSPTRKVLTAGFQIR